MVREEVGPEEIADVVEAWTGIPTGRLLEGETAKLLRMEDVIGERLIGQRAAVTAVSDAVRRSRAGISDPDRPTGSFLFLGPTGVGKTELAKSLADFLFDDERAIVRIDMSEYSEKHSVARLVGAPPGYVGYEEGGQLTEAVRRRPYSVVLLDEVEKAHPEVFDILLQVLDDGRLTDGQGRTVDFRNVVLILTSNLGSTFLVDPTLDEEKKRDSVMAVVRQSFKPEFLNRLDEVVLFDALTRDELTHIVDLQIAAARPSGSPSAGSPSRSPRPRTSGWPRTGYDPAYGARPLRRLVQTAIGDPLARLLLAGEVLDGSTSRSTSTRPATAWRSRPRRHDPTADIGCGPARCTRRASADDRRWLGRVMQWTHERVGREARGARPRQVTMAGVMADGGLPAARRRPVRHAGHGCARRRCASGRRRVPRRAARQRARARRRRRSSTCCARWSWSAARSPRRARCSRSSSSSGTGGADRLQRRRRAAAVHRRRSSPGCCRSSSRSRPRCCGAGRRGTGSPAGAPASRRCSRRPGRPSGPTRGAPGRRARPSADGAPGGAPAGMSARQPGPPADRPESGPAPAARPYGTAPAGLPARSSRAPERAGTPHGAARPHGRSRSRPG